MTQSFIAREQSSPQDDDSILLQELHPSPHSHCGLWGQQMIRTVWCEAAYPRSRVLIQTIATLLLLVCWFPGPEFNIQVNAKLKGFVFQLTPRPMWLNWISVADFQLPRYDSHFSARDVYKRQAVTIGTLRDKPRISRMMIPYAFSIRCPRQRIEKVYLTRELGGSRISRGMFAIPYASW